MNTLIRVRAGVGFGVVLLTLLAQNLSAAPQAAAPGKLSVLVLPFENQTGDGQLEHWGNTMQRLLESQLGAVKSVRVLPSRANGRSTLNLKAGAAPGPAAVRKLGESVEARRVIWGSFHRTNGQWSATARVMNVARGETSREFRAVATDWFDLRDKLGAQLLAELGRKASNAERVKMTNRFTTSAVGLEWHSKARFAQAHDRPLPEQEAAIREALAADPLSAEFLNASAALAGGQGRIEEAEKTIRQAIELEPDLSRAHATLGWILALTGQFEAAEKAAYQATRLGPEDPMPLGLLGQIASAQNDSSRMLTFLQEVRRLNPNDAENRALLSVAHARRGNRAASLQEISEALRLGAGLTAVEQFVAQACELLLETAIAVEHYEKFLANARRDNLQPGLHRGIEEHIQSLRAKLTPSFIEVSLPKRFSPDDLRKVLREKLDEGEQRLAVNPLASNAKMKAWALDLTREGKTDLEKVQRLFEALARRPDGRNEGGTRTAEQVFSLWHEKDESFTCQEYAKLFVALARDAGIDAFYVHLEKDYSGRVVYHDCAAVFVGGKTLLVDPAYRWFGAPHRSFLLLDDVQVVAHQLFQPDEAGEHLRRCRAAGKLHPGFAWGQLQLVRALQAADKVSEARTALALANEMEPDRWDALQIEGRMDAAAGDMRSAVLHLQKSIELNPANPESHLALGTALANQGKLKEAREEFRATLRHNPSPELREAASRSLARANEELGED